MLPFGFAQGTANFTVKPRRDFIVKNALDVSNLDV